MDCEKTEALIESIRVPLAEWSDFLDWTPCYAFDCTHHAERGSLGGLSMRECGLLRDAIAKAKTLEKQE